MPIYEKEKTLLLVVAILIGVFCLIRFLLRFLRKEKARRTIDLIIVILVLVEVFFVIHFCYCYQYGFPASVLQNKEHLLLSASDWLGFLGGYLGFAGSLVMAYLVYMQSEMINKFTISDYEPSATMLVLNCVNSSQYNMKFEGYCGRDILLRMTDGTLDKFYAVHFSSNGQYTENSMVGMTDVLIFCEVINNSKAKMNALLFTRIDLNIILPEKNNFFYERIIALDPIGDTADILPEARMKRCFIIHGIPEEFGLGWMTFQFTTKEKCNYRAKVLVSKVKDRGIVFPGDMNQFEVSGDKSK